jgi:4-amino-4-deoxy-L-arabinose transferase-like glycosyltransferase
LTAAGGGRFWAGLLLLAACCCLWWAAHLSFSFAGFYGDPVWYLEPARNFARGWGLVTRLLYPAQVAQFPSPLELPVSPLHHGPLALLILGLGYAAAGLRDWVPLAQGYVMTLLSGALAAGLARGLGGNRAGWLAAAFFWLNPMMLNDSVSALTDPLFVLLVTAGGACLWASREGKEAARWLALAGACLGLASATRLAGQAYWLGFFAAAWYLHRSPRALLPLLAGLALPMAGLALYNYQTAGILFYSPGIYILLWSKTFPGFRSSTSYMNLTTAQAVLAYPQDILQKSVTGPLYAAVRWLEGSRVPYFTAAALLAALWRYDSRSCGRFRTFVLALAAPVFAVNFIISYGAVHYVTPLFPLMAAMAAAAIWEFIDDRAPLLKRPWVGLPLAALLLLSEPALALKEAWKGSSATASFAVDRAAFGRWLSERTDAGAVLYSDDPPLVVWEADRSAVALPATLDDARKTFAHLPPDALVLTSLRVDSSDYDPAFERSFREKSPLLGMEPCEEFRAGRIAAIIFKPKAACPRKRARA